MHGPHITYIQVDWAAAAATLKDLNGPLPLRDVFAGLNRATSEVFPKIAASPVPVLLPFDTLSLLRDRAGDQPDKPIGDYLTSVRAPPFFLAGPGGYDAAFPIYARDLPELGMSYSARIDVHIGGSALLYELDDPIGLIGW